MSLVKLFVLELMSKNNVIITPEMFILMLLFVAASGKTLESHESFSSLSHVYIQDTPEVIEARRAHLEAVEELRQFGHTLSPSKNVLNIPVYNLESTTAISPNDKHIEEFVIHLPDERQRISPVGDDDANVEQKNLIVLKVNNEKDGRFPLLLKIYLPHIIHNNNPYYKYYEVVPSENNENKKGSSVIDIYHGNAKQGSSVDHITVGNGKQESAVDNSNHSVINQGLSARDIYQDDISKGTSVGNFDSGDTKQGLSIDHTIDGSTKQGSSAFVNQGEVTNNVKLTHLQQSSDDYVESFVNHLLSNHRNDSVIKDLAERNDDKPSFPDINVISFQEHISGSAQAKNQAEIEVDKFITRYFGIAPVSESVQTNKFNSTHHDETAVDSEILSKIKPDNNKPSGGLGDKVIFVEVKPYNNESNQIDEEALEKYLANLEEKYRLGSQLNESDKSDVIIFQDQKFQPINLDAPFDDRFGGSHSLKRAPRAGNLNSETMGY